MIDSCPNTSTGTDLAALSRLSSGLSQNCADQVMAEEEAVSPPFSSKHPWIRCANLAAGLQAGDVDASEDENSVLGMIESCGLTMAADLPVSNS